MFGFSKKQFKVVRQFSDSDFHYVVFVDKQGKQQTRCAKTPEQALKEAKKIWGKL